MKPNFLLYKIFDFQQPQYIQTNMDHKYTNFQQLLNRHGHAANHGLFSDFKHLTVTTAQGQRQLPQNQPIAQDGVFWNSNRILSVSQPGASIRAFDPVFENQLLREHRVVIKVALNTYCFLIPEQQNEIYKQNHQNTENWVQGSNQQRIDNFINELRYCHEFRSNEIENLNQILKQFPHFLKIFERLTEFVPSPLKREFYYIIYKGLELNIQLSEKGGIADKNLDQCIEECLWATENENRSLFEEKANIQIFKKMFSITIYTAIMYANGKCTNKFYSQIPELTRQEQSDLLLKLHPGNPNKYMLLEDQQDKLKKVVYLRRSISYPMSKEIKGRKRQHSNEEV